MSFNVGLDFGSVQNPSLEECAVVLGTVGPGLGPGPLGRRPPRALQLMLVLVLEVTEHALPGTAYIGGALCGIADAAEDAVEEEAQAADRRGIGGNADGQDLAGLGKEGQVGKGGLVGPQLA